MDGAREQVGEALVVFEVARVQVDARSRIERVLRARGLFSEPGEEPPPLEGAEDSAMPLLWSASLLSRTAAGTGDKVPRLVDPSLASAPREQLDLPRGALSATSDGYSLHAATRLKADARESLERLVISQCLWSASGEISISGAPPAGSVDMARPPHAQGRLMLREDGKVIWNLRKRIPFGAPHRGAPIPLRGTGAYRRDGTRGFSKDVLSCPRCGSRRHLLAAISDGRTLRGILAYLGLPTEPLPIAPAREPPQAVLAW